MATSSKLIIKIHHHPLSALTGLARSCGLEWADSSTGGALTIGPPGGLETPHLRGSRGEIRPRTTPPISKQGQRLSLEQGHGAQGRPHSPGSQVVTHEHPGRMAVMGARKPASAAMRPQKKPGQGRIAQMAPQHSTAPAKQRNTTAAACRQGPSSPSVRWWRCFRPETRTGRSAGSASRATGRRRTGKPTRGIQSLPGCTNRKSAAARA